MVLRHDFTYCWGTGRDRGAVFRMDVKCGDKRTKLRLLRIHVSHVPNSPYRMANGASVQTCITLPGKPVAHNYGLVCWDFGYFGV